MPKMSACKRESERASLCLLRLNDYQHQQHFDYASSSSSFDYAHSDYSPTVLLLLMGCQIDSKLPPPPAGRKLLARSSG